MVHKAVNSVCYRQSDLEGPDCSCDMSLEDALPLATASPSGEARVVDADGVPVGAISV